MGVETVMKPEWEVKAGGEVFVVQTCSAREALSYAERRTGRPATLLALHEPKAVPYQDDPKGPKGRRRAALLPRAMMLRSERGMNNEEIARLLKVPRTTVRDWFRRL